MSLKLMYITNRPDVASICDKAGVDRIFVDLETVGKAERQGLVDTVKSYHSFDDISAVKKSVTNAEILVRINQIYDGSEEEIEVVANSDADIVMLPYFHIAKEAETFLRLLRGRKKTCLLFETPGSVDNADEILSLEGIDEAFIGLNDMHMGYKMKFMFQLLADGTVEKLCNKFRAKGIPYGFGGIARPESGMLKGKYILGEHYRLGSEAVILSRSFLNLNKVTDIKEIEDIMISGVKEIRNYEELLSKANYDELLANKDILLKSVTAILASMA